MRTYIIEETASYYVKAKSAKAAEKIFLDAISTRKAPITVEVHEREVYKDPENREVPR